MNLTWIDAISVWYGLVMVFSAEDTTVSKIGAIVVVLGNEV